MSVTLSRPSIVVCSTWSTLCCLPAMMADENPRPHKRARLDSSPAMPSSSLSSLTSAPTSPSKSQNPQLKPLPPAILLVSLPALLAHPPTHRYYIPSLCLSLCALRKCLTIPALSPEIECRAWTGLAEVGMRVISGGLHGNEDYPWARGIEAEVREALYSPISGALYKAFCVRLTKLSVKRLVSPRAICIHELYICLYIDTHMPIPYVVYHSTKGGRIAPRWHTYELIPQ